MKISGWTRLWIIASLALAACGEPVPAKDHDRVIRMEMACKQFTSSIGWWRKGDLVEGEPQVVRDEQAIKVMLEACEALLNDLAEGSS